MHDAADTAFGIQQWDLVQYHALHQQQHEIRRIVDAGGDRAACAKAHLLLEHAMYGFGQIDALQDGTAHVAIGDEVNQRAIRLNDDSDAGAVGIDEHNGLTQCRLTSNRKSDDFLGCHTIRRLHFMRFRCIAEVKTGVLQIRRSEPNIGIT